MNIIKHISIFPILNSDRFLMVNGVYGFVDSIGGKEKDTILRWRTADIIIPQNDYERDLYDKLVLRKYIVEPFEEEEQFHKVISTLKMRQNRSPFSSTICFVLTYNCNFACPYCYEKGITNNRTLSKELVDIVFDNCTNISTISLFGGEPLLPANRDIINYIVERANKATKFAVITNGYYLLEFFDLFKQLNIANIQVTLDGTEREHNKTRHLINGMPTYRRIMEGVKVYAEEGIPLTIRMNVSENNIEDCFRAKNELLKETWAKEIRFEMQPLFQSSPDDTQSLMSRLGNENARSASHNIIFEKTVPFFKFLSKTGKLLPVIRSCDCEGNMRFYDPIGNIYNCILAVGNPSKKIGTYYPNVSLKEKSFLTRDISQIPACLECENALLCGGGCPNVFPDGSDIYRPNCGSFVFELIQGIKHQKLIQ